jgi:DNA polymerase kappa
MAAALDALLTGMIQLIFVKPDYSKYTVASSRIFDVLHRYDPDMASVSLDEAYMNIVRYFHS